MTFAERLEQVSRRQNSLLCVGLDGEYQRLPVLLRQEADPLVAFNRAIIDATHDLVCAYKLNLAFYEAHGASGWRALEKTVAYLAGRVPVIADAKRADIGHTSRLYAHALFDTLRVDAATLNPYLGRDALQPFLDYADRGCFILCLTSNPGARDVQFFPDASRPLYQEVARQVEQWNEQGNCGLVVGATYPQELRIIRRLVPEMPLLLPGVGAQGGNLAWAVQYGTNARGVGLLISASRSVIYAFTGTGQRFQDDVRGAAVRLREQINTLRAKLRSNP